jgi:cytidine deaminase
LKSFPRKDFALIAAMSQQHIRIDYEEFESASELNEDDRQLLVNARVATRNAYAPYSNFHVGAAARLGNGELITGSNQENASFPAGLCAERVMLSAISSLYPQMSIAVIAVSYEQPGAESLEPIAPCGICRQTLQEYEFRTKQPIRLILSAMNGKVIIFSSVSDLLPLAFTKQAMQ